MTKAQNNVESFESLRLVRKALFSFREHWKVIDGNKPAEVEWATGDALCPPF